MPVRQQIFALVTSLLVLYFTIDMVRKRRLREEYSVLWLTTSIIMLVLVIKYEWLVALTVFIGAGLPTTTLFIGSVIFLMLIAVQFSIKISKLTDQVKNLAQDNALLRAEIAGTETGRGKKGKGKGCLSGRARDSAGTDH
jgi:hypothetical protein